MMMARVVDRGTHGIPSLLEIALRDNRRALPRAGGLRPSAFGHVSETEVRIVTGSTVFPNETARPEDRRPPYST